MLKKENCLVDFDMYKAYINQLNRDCMYIKEILNDSDNSIEKEIYAKRDDRLLCSQILYKNAPSKCYIYADPNPNDALTPKRIKQIELDTSEEVQAFLNGLKTAGLLK